GGNRPPHPTRTRRRRTAAPDPSLFALARLGRHRPFGRLGALGYSALGRNGQPVGLPLARGDLAGGIAHHPGALALAHHEMAGIDIAVGIGRDALAVDLAFLPAALVAEAVRRDEPAL